MQNGIIRIGLIGAGANTRLRHIPGFREQRDVEIVAVANRSRESGERIAGEYEIPKVYDNWVDLLDDDSIDAVCVGTWPYMHRSLVLASLFAGKHVLTEARMAMNADEAHEMLDASRLHPDLVTQIVPAPQTLEVDNTVIEHVGNGSLGDILAVRLRVCDYHGRSNRADTFIDTEAPAALASGPQPQRLQHTRHGHLVRDRDALCWPGGQSVGDDPGVRQPAERRKRRDAGGVGSGPCERAGGNGLRGRRRFSVGARSPDCKPAPSSGFSAPTALSACKGRPSTRSCLPSAATRP